VKELTYSREAAKALRKHGNVADRIRKALAAYAANPQVHANNVTQLVGSGAKRLRVGDFRVIFDETETTITVTKIAPRCGVYT
jgi:mRNA interferase RelE/StbE